MVPLIPGYNTFLTKKQPMGCFFTIGKIWGFTTLNAHTEAFIQNLPSQVVTILIHRLLSFYTIFVLILMFLRVFVNDYRKSQNMVMHTFFETLRGGTGKTTKSGTPKLKLRLFWYCATRKSKMHSKLNESAPYSLFTSWLFFSRWVSTICVVFINGAHR